MDGKHDMTVPVNYLYQKPEPGLDMYNNER